MIKAESIGFVHTITRDEDDKTSKKSNVWIYVVVLLVLFLVAVAVILFIRSRRKGGGCLPLKSRIRKDKNDIMQKKLVFNMDEDCVGLEGPDLPPM